MRKIQVVLAIILMVGISFPAAARRKVIIDKIRTKSIPQPTFNCPIEVFLEDDNTLTIIFNQASENVSVNIQSIEGNTTNNTGLTVSENDILTFDLPESTAGTYLLFVEINGTWLTGTFQAI